MSFRKGTFFLLIGFIFSQLPASAQTELKWVTRYMGTGTATDRASDMVIDVAGNVYVTGTATGPGGNFDYYTVKYNNAGAEQWKINYNGTGNAYDEARSIAVDGSGNVYVTGMSAAAGNNYDIATVKYNASGVQQWAMRFNGDGNGLDEGYDVKIDGSGNVHVTGTSTRASGTDIITIKYNSAGAQQWAMYFDANTAGNDDGGYSLAVDASGNVYVTGYSYWSSAQDYNVMTLKYNSAGALQWSRPYNGPGSAYDAGFSIAVDPSGNVYATGQALVSGVIDFDIVTIKMNSAGTIQWSQLYGGSAGDLDKPNDIKVDGGGYIYVAGRVKGTGSGEDFVALKYSPAGGLRWDNLHNGTGNNYDEAKMLMLENSDSNVYVAGYSHNGASKADYLAVKYDSAGVEQWKYTYNSPSNNVDQAVAIAIDDTVNVYLSGQSMGSTTDFDYATLKICQYYSEISGNATICAGDSVQLGATGGTIYSWSPAAGLSNPNIANPKASPAVTTTYVLTATNWYNCTDIDSITIVVNPLPNPVITSDGNSSICAGESVTLSTDTMVSYLWNNGHTTISINADTTGSYTVTVADTNGCSNTAAPYNLTVNNLPAVDAGTDTAICTGDTAQLVGTGAHDYAWSPTATLASPNNDSTLAYPTADTKYYLVATDTVTGCINNDSVSVTVNPLPVVTVSSDTSICPGDSAQLTAGGGTAYLWSPAATLNNAAIANPKASPASTTTYNVTVTDVNTCSKTGKIKVTVFPKPAPVITPAGPVNLCIGDSITLTSNTFASYLWNTGSTTQSIVADSTGIYQVSVTDNNTCSDTSAPVSVTINNLPNVTAGNDVQICIGSSTQLDANGAHIYKWSPNIRINNTNIKDPTVNPLDTIVYFVVGTDSITGCSNKDTVTVIVNPLPVITKSNDTTICAGVSVNLFATGGQSYQWTPATGLTGANTATPVATPAVTTTYTVAVTDSNSCSRNGTVKITVNQLPTPVLNVGADTAFCAGDSILLIVSNWSKYMWNTGSTTKTIYVKNTNTYTVTVTDSKGCENAVSTNVTVNPNPVANAGSDVNICFGTSTQLNATGGDQYLWLPSAGILDNGNIANPVATPISPVTRFIVTVTFGATGCSDKDTVWVYANTLPGATAGPDKEICPGESVPLGGSGGHTYVWTPVSGLDNPSIANPIASPTSTTTYTVLITDTATAGCKSDNVTVTVNPAPMIDLGSDIPLSRGDSVQLFISGDVSNSTFLWSPGIWLNDMLIANPFAKPFQDITYYVTVTNAFGCVATDSVNIIVTIPQITPEGISPNQDGRNDTWKLEFVQELYPDATVEVYNRWGLRVFHSKGYPEEWDGTYQGSPLPVGTYYYIINLGDGSKPLTGPLTIIR